MKKQTRKEQLRDRAHAYALAREQDSTGKFTATMSAYGDGYRAAMKDMRKLVAECQKELNATYPNDPAKRIAMKNHCVRVRVQRFLGPIR